MWKCDAFRYGLVDNTVEKSVLLYFTKQLISSSSSTESTRIGMLTPALIYNIIILNSKAFCGRESTGLSLMAQLLVKLLMVWQVIRGKNEFCHSKLFDIYIYISHCHWFALSSVLWLVFENSVVNVIVCCSLTLLTDFACWLLLLLSCYYYWYCC